MCDYVFHYDALKAATKLYSYPYRDNESEDKVLVRCYERCIDFLLIAEPFWEMAPYRCSGYGNGVDATTRDRLTNAPTDTAGLQEALDSIPDI